MTARELIKKYLAFFESKGHKIIPGASLVPENDPSALFISAGMHPLIPYLLGEPHPAGNRLVNFQKCIRTGDIDEVGDGFHHTFFLMLGNWSLGDPASPDGIGKAGYFKDEAISMSFEFLTSPEWLGIDPQKLYVSIFAGDKDAPRDEESTAAWQREFSKAGIGTEIGKRIFHFGKKENWWGPVGETGPCGPDTEMFFDTDKESCGPGCDPSCQCGKYIEIWNDVFMEYNHKTDGTYEPLAQRNVDTGMGVARVTAVLNGLGDDDYKTELFAPIIEKIEELSGRNYTPIVAQFTARPKERKLPLAHTGQQPGGKFTNTNKLSTIRSMRIIADHIRAATFCIADGVLPSNTDRGYVVRRLIRRSIRHGHLLGIEKLFSTDIAKVIISKYQDLYPELKKQERTILKELKFEEEQFGKTLKRGLKEFDKLIANRNRQGKKSGSGELPVEELAIPQQRKTAQITGVEAFDLYQTYGFPLELTRELAGEKNLTVDEDGFKKEFQEHQKKSRAGAEKKFTGGLADHSEIVTKYHTTTHLLHTALRQILGEHIQQKGSNITPERLRFDFSHPKKMTEEELQQVENLVNEKIQGNLPIKMETMSFDEAKNQGALAFFAQKYGNQVKVYSIGEYSKEVCGGPHVTFTGELGKFEIIKEKSIGRGTRRIRAVLH